MALLRRIAMGISGVIVAAVVLAVAAPKTAHAVVSALVTVANTEANPVPAQEVKESRANYITVSFSAATSTYTEVSSDGTISSTPFVIPSGEQFVITDVNWMTICASLFGGPFCNKSVGDSTILVLGGSNGTTGSYMSRAIYAGGTGFLNAGANDSFKSGLVVKQLPAPSILAQGGGEEILVVNLHGYLVP